MKYASQPKHPEVKYATSQVYVTWYHALRARFPTPSAYSLSSKVCPCYHPSATTMLVFFMHALYAQLTFQGLDKKRMVMYTSLKL